MTFGDDLCNRIAVVGEGKSLVQNAELRLDLHDGTEKKRLYSKSERKRLPQPAPHRGSAYLSAGSEKAYESGSAVSDDRHGILGESGTPFSEKKKIIWGCSSTPTTRKD